MTCCCWLSTVLIAISAISILSYVLPWLYDTLLCPEQDLKKKYNAKWALVTGASSGIGRALTEKLAKQGINVVMVALDDKLFADSFDYMTKTYTNIQFRRVGCNLGKQGGYMQAIKDATKDLEITLIFNNAGYVSTGHFADSELEKPMANYECNATAPVQITHHFASIMRQKGLKGCITFTSSPAGLMPCPITVMYGATKAFLTEFATSLAAELHYDGIDVLVVHPSPVDTQFYSGNTHKISAMSAFQKTACSPETVASTFFQSIGRTVVRDQGYYPICIKMLLKIIDYNVLSLLFSRTAHTSGDFLKSRKDYSKKN